MNDEPGSVPVSEWTDDEWIRAMREFSPESDTAEAERSVARWRKEKGE
jgi:hypothetical protein